MIRTACWRFFLQLVPIIRFGQTSKTVVFVYKSLLPFEKGVTAKQIAQRESLDAEEYKRVYSINSSFDIDNKFSVLLTSNFLLHPAIEVTHQETTDDGWFSQTYTVSDGWKWTDEYPHLVTGSITVNSTAFNCAYVYNTLIDKIPAEHKKISEGVYSIQTTINGSKVESTIRFTLEDKCIGVQITF